MMNILSKNFSVQPYNVSSLKVLCNDGKEYMIYGIQHSLHEPIQLECTYENVQKYLTSYIHPDINNISYYEIITLNQLGLIYKNEYSNQLMKYIPHYRLWNTNVTNYMITEESMNIRLNIMCINDTNVIDDLMFIPLANPLNDSSHHIKEMNELMKHRHQNITSFFDKVNFLNQSNKIYYKLVLRSVIEKVPFFQSLLFHEKENQEENEFVFKRYNKKYVCDALNIIHIHEFSIRYSETKRTSIKMYLNDIIYDNYELRLIRLLEIVEVLNFFCFNDDIVIHFKREIYHIVTITQRDIVLYHIMNDYYPSYYLKFYDSIHQKNGLSSISDDGYIILTYDFISSLCKDFGNESEEMLVSYKNITFDFIIVTNLSDHKNKMFNIFFLYKNTIYFFYLIKSGLLSQINNVCISSCTILKKDELTQNEMRKIYDHAFKYMAKNFIKHESNIDIAFFVFLDYEYHIHKNIMYYNSLTNIITFQDDIHIRRPMIEGNVIMLY